MMDYSITAMRPVKRRRMMVRRLLVRMIVVALAGLVLWIAVGMPITGHPPHRTGRAAFPHPAPTLD